MLSVRSAILTSLAIFALYLIIGAVSLMGPPDSNGAGVDSYGTRRDGHRAVFELLTAFGVPTERRTDPPSPSLPTTSTLVMWLPNEDIVANEPAYLERLLPWIEQGGRLVVAVQPMNRNWKAVAMAKARRRSSSHTNVDLWSVLKLNGIEVESVSPVDPSEPSSARRGDVLSEAERRRRLREAMEESVGLHKPQEFTSVEVSATGTLDRLAPRVKRLQVPSPEAGGLKMKAEPPASGRIEAVLPGGEVWTMAAAFPRGRGEIVIVSEPMLLMNTNLATFDNSVLAHDLLAPAGRSVVFDEFYHGLSVRGNALWLLTQRSYLVVTLSILGLLSVTLWRLAILLGPPLETVAKSRRTIVEYIEAMGRFLNQGRGCRPFLLHEIRAGLLRTVGDRLGLPSARQDAESIILKLTRRSQAEADHFQESLRQLDAALAQGPRLSEFDAIRAVQRVSRCL